MLPPSCDFQRRFFIKHRFARCYLAAIFGNLLEHFDNALYVFAAPFIAPLFLGEKDPLSALILLYAIPLMGCAARPLGALFFGRIGDRQGRKKALFLSLLGLAVTTVAIGCLPTYHRVGNTAFFGLASIKILQTFFLAGESAGGAVFALEHTPKGKRSLVASLYDLSTMAGILLASGLCLIFHRLGIIASAWRFLFYCGALTAFFGLFLRKRTQEPEEFLSKSHYPSDFSFRRAGKDHFKTIFALTLASGFSHVTYAFAFVFMAVYAPLMTSLSQAKALALNTPLMLFDALLLPLFGYLAMRWGKEKIMLFGAGGIVLVAIPFFTFLKGASLATVIALRLSIVFFGVAFAAPYYAWAVEKIPPFRRFTLLSLSNAFAYYFGKPTTALCLWLYKKTHLAAAPGIYLAVMATAALAAVWALSKSPVLALSYSQKKFRDDVSIPNRVYSSSQPP